MISQKQVTQSEVESAIDSLRQALSVVERVMFEATYVEADAALTVSRFRAEPGLAVKFATLAELLSVASSLSHPAWLIRHATLTPGRFVESGENGE